jgi:hypothetical protein
VRFRTRLKRTVRRKTITPAKRRLRREIRKRPLFTCGGCGRKYNSPFGHRCSNAGDFGKRKRARQRAERQAAAKAKRAEQRQRANERVARARATERRRASRRVRETRRRERERAAERVKRARASRPKPRKSGRPAHDYRNCRDHDCTRQACEAYREGLADAEEEQ